MKAMTRDRGSKPMLVLLRYTVWVNYRDVIDKFCYRFTYALYKRRIAWQRSPTKAEELTAELARMSNQELAAHGSVILTQMFVYGSAIGLGLHEVWKRKRANATAKAHAQHVNARLATLNQDALTIAELIQEQKQNFVQTDTELMTQIKERDAKFQLIQKQLADIHNKVLALKKKQQEGGTELNPCESAFLR